MSARCKVGALLEPGSPLDADDLGSLDAALSAHRRDVPATALAKALTLEGHPVSATTVKDHRGERCACYREKAV